MRNIRIILRLLANIVFVIANIILFILVIKTLLFDYYDPRDLVITYFNVVCISGLLLCVRWLIKPEYKHIYNKSTGSGKLCGLCFNDMNECICAEDNYVPVSSITEEMFNEAMDDIYHDDRNDTM